MKFRSFNQELLIATALLINVFNDIIIDRRRHGFNSLQKKLASGITLDDLVQQKIQIPCILGQRSHILRSLQNQPGKYKLPLIILTNKSIKTDTVRMVDLHSDVFYQQDESFSKLQPQDPLYKPYQLGKRRGQPVNMQFQMTIITKYKEDLDQILSNWVVFFRPDVYVKWIFPKNIIKSITSQITWNHNVGFNLPIQFNPTNVFSYTATTSFTFKTWLFPGIQKLDPDLENVIKKFKFFPNRGQWWNQQDIQEGMKDSNDSDQNWSFGELIVNQVSGQTYYDPETKYTLLEIPRTNQGDAGFWGLQSDQEFYTTTDITGMKAGKYMVNNIFSQNYPQISGDPIISEMKYNRLIGDFFSNYDKELIGNWNKYQSYLQLDPIKNITSMSFLKNVYFKGGFDSDCVSATPPSGDFLYQTFYKRYIKNKGTQFQEITSANFGDSQEVKMSSYINYDITSKKFTLSASFNNGIIDFNAVSIMNSSNGVYQKLSLDTVRTQSYPIRFNFQRACDNNFKFDDSKQRNQVKNVILFNKLIYNRRAQFLIQDQQFIDRAIKIRNVLKTHEKCIDLNQTKTGVFEIVFNDMKVNQFLKQKNLDLHSFNSLLFITQTSDENFNYQVYLNKSIYLIVKSQFQNPENAQIYDFGIISPLKFSTYHAPLFEIAIPQSRLLLGFNFDMEI